MGDLPAESRVTPSAWGEFRLIVPDLAGQVLEDDASPGGTAEEMLNP